MFGLRKKTPENPVTALLRRIPDQDAPTGWRRGARIAVGGLTEVGFSRRTGYLLVISSAGRGVIDCASGEKLARDDEVYGGWYDSIGMTCAGIGPLAGETVAIAGLCGGGLPAGNRYGETLEYAAPQWPLEEMIFCPPGKSALIERFQGGCVRLATDYIRCAGFSWCGEFIVMATSSDIMLWQRKNSGSG